jgi:uncharacterized membrane protein YciS (DUF1049 family)
MFRRIAIALLVAVIFIATLVFTYHNEGEIRIHLIFAEVDTTVSIAFIVTFALGWLFGVLSMGLYALRQLNEKRTLKRSLQASETEVSSLRNLPLNDAD